MMMSLPDGWQSDYDGTRWLFRHKAMGVEQYHFPQPGDEWAGFLHDAGAGPVELTPEESLAIEQRAKRRSISGWENDTKSNTKSSGGKREKKKIEDIEEENAMSATGYYDPMFYLGAYNDVSPLGEDDGEGITHNKAGKGRQTSAPDIISEATPPISNSELILNPLNSQSPGTSFSTAQPFAIELPGVSQQTWSPVGHVAELATQETVKCAEELAPVELDATSFTAVPIRTNVEPAELPTHRSPVEEKAPNPKPTKPVTQLVDSSSLTSASFAYSPLKPQTKPINRLSSSASIRRKPVSSSTDPNKYQPWKPSPGIIEQPSQAHHKPPEPLPQTSVLENQNSELGNMEPKNSRDESSVPGDVPNVLAPPSAPSKSAPIESSNNNNEAPSVPVALQPAQRPAKEPASLETINQQSIPGAQARHDSISDVVVSHDLSYAPSVLKPGGRQSSSNVQEGEGNPKPNPPYSSGQYQQSVAPHRPYEHAVQVSPGHNEQPSVTSVNTFPSLSNHGISVYPVESSKPAFEPSTSHCSQVNSEPCIGGDEKIPMVAPLKFVKRHSSKSSEVSSIAPETQDPGLHPSKPTLTQSDEISAMISGIGSFTPQATASVVDMQQSSVVPQIPGQGPPAATSISNTIPVAATPTTHTPSISPPTNVGTATTQNRPNIHHIHNPPSSAQEPFVQNQRPPSSLPSQIGNPSKISMSPGPLGPQGSTVNPISPQTSAIVTPSHQPSQTNNAPHTNEAYQLELHSSHGNNTAQRPPQASHAHTTAPTPNANGVTQAPITTAMQQTPYQPQGHSKPSPNPITGPSTAGGLQAVTEKPHFQHPATAGPSSHQPTARPPVGQQIPSPAAAQISSQAYQHPSPVTHAVSPIQSQVSSPAQSIASLHISQSSTPANTFATMNTVTSNNSGFNVNINQPTTAPIRPPSVPAHALTQPVENVKPPISSHSTPASAAGILQAQSLPTANPPAKPYPMLPGQVTPLPSQIGSAPVPLPTSQPVPNNYAKPTANTQQVPVGQQPTQTAGGPTAHHAMPGQTNPMVNLPHGNLAYGPASSQAQIKPPQQPNHSSYPGIAQTGGPRPSADQPQQQSLASYPSQIAPNQPHNLQMAVPSSAVSSPVGGQPTFSPPPVASTTTTLGKPPSLADAGKGMKKWAKKMWNNPAIKQTTVAIGGAIMAESVGMNAGAGAQLANNIYANTNRPPLNHAQTAPPQAHGIPGAAHQYQPVQIGQQQQPVKIQPLHQQQNQQQHQQQGRPQPGYTHPSQLHSGHSQLGYSQPAHSQTTYQPVGTQTVGRPPIVYNQNSAPTVGVAVNLNAQAQAQASFYQQQQQQQQYALVNPVTVNNSPQPVLVNPGAPNSQAPGQVNIDVNTAATAAIMVGSAIGTALRPDHSQPQHAYGNAQGYAQQEHTSHAGSHGAENHGYSAENHAGTHEQAHDSSNPPPASATYTDNNYTATETTYTDNSSYSVNNVYVDNTDVVNNTIIIDNSTAGVVDTAYNTTSYADATSFNSTDITTNMSIDVDMNSTLYANGGVSAFSVDESFNITSTSDVTGASVDYSGDSWGDFNC
ncbi:hypothetical protein ANO14919_084180 [Xylariales sp. No.14919]|nr:hypothetical protein ANO14919_084180 [Xylariales sp. No.14919]